MYYRFLDKFHVIPESWSDLFEYIHYNSIDSEINRAVQNSLKDGK